MIDAAFLSLLLITLYTRNMSGLFFVLVCIIHDIFFGSLDGFFYYGSAAILSYLTLFAINPNSNVQFICIASIILNVFGYITWYFYLEPTIYNHGFLSLYVLAAILCIKDYLDGGGLGTFHWRNFSTNFDRRSLNFFRDQGAPK